MIRVSNTFVDGWIFAFALRRRENLGRESFYDDDDDDDFFFIFWLNVYWKEMSGLRIL